MSKPHLTWRSCEVEIHAQSPRYLHVEGTAHFSPSLSMGEMNYQDKWRVGGGQPGVCASGRNVNRLVLVGDLRVDE